MEIGTGFPFYTWGISDSACGSGSVDWGSTATVMGVKTLPTLAYPCRIRPIHLVVLHVFFTMFTYSGVHKFVNALFQKSWDVFVFFYFSIKVNVHFSMKRGIERHKRLRPIAVRTSSRVNQESCQVKPSWFKSSHNRGSSQAIIVVQVKP